MKHYFVSDLHLGATYVADARQHERQVIAFLDGIKADAASLFLVGDVLDYWFEYRYVVPRGHVRFFGKLAELADAGVRIHWFTGNHDVWLRDYLSSEIGLTVHYGHEQMCVGGLELLVSHGDDVGRQPAMYRFTRWCFYNPVCQWLYAAIHPRWTTWVATGWSADNRTKRNPALEQQAQQQALDNLKAFAEQYAGEHPEVDAFVFGHIHVAHQCQVGNRAAMVCLGDWLTKFTYAVIDDSGAIALHRFGDAASTPQNP